MARRPRFHVHYTPTYASWPNQVEIWVWPIPSRIRTAPPAIGRCHSSPSFSTVPSACTCTPFSRSPARQPGRRPTFDTIRLRVLTIAAPVRKRETMQNSSPVFRVSAFHPQPEILPHCLAIPHRPPHLPSAHPPPCNYSFDKDWKPRSAAVFRPAVRYSSRTSGGRVRHTRKRLRSTSRKPVLSRLQEATSPLTRCRWISIR